MPGRRVFTSKKNKSDPKLKDSSSESDVESVNSDVSLESDYITKKRSKREIEKKRRVILKCSDDESEEEEAIVGSDSDESEEEEEDEIEDNSDTSESIKKEKKKKKEKIKDKRSDKKSKRRGYRRKLFRMPRIEPIHQQMVNDIVGCHNLLIFDERNKHGTFCAELHKTLINCLHIHDPVKRDSILEQLEDEAECVRVGDFVKYLTINRRLQREILR